MNTINFEVKKVKPLNKISDRQLELFKPNEEKKNDKSKKKSSNKLVIPLLNKRTTLRHKLIESVHHLDHRKNDDDDSKKRKRNDVGVYSLKKLKDDVEIGDVEDGDYDEVDIEEFGLALFRGMGWKDGTKGVSAPVVISRSRGLGLGAEEVVEKGDGELKKGGFCEVIAGKKKGCTGVVEGWEEVRVVVRIDGEVEAFNPNFVVDISETEFNAKLNKHQQPKHGLQLPQKLTNGQLKPQSNKQTALHNKEKHNSAMSKSNVSRTNENDENDDDSDDGEETWVHEDLIVRVVSKSYRRGQFYKEKVSIVDVTSAHTCMCRTPNQVILEGVKQSMLETVVPKENNCHLLILTHPHKFKRARLVERRKQTQEVVVRLEESGDDDDVILILSYDDICLYKPPFH